MAKKTTAAAAEKPEAAKKTTAAKKTASAAKKTTTAAKKTTATAAAAKKTADKAVTKIQFDGCEYDVAEIVEKAKADYKASNKAAVKSINVYIKPEEKAAYYVVNGKTEGKVDL